MKRFTSILILLVLVSCNTNKAAMYNYDQPYTKVGIMLKKGFTGHYVISKGDTLMISPRDYQILQKTAK